MMPCDVTLCADSSEAEKNFRRPPRAGRRLPPSVTIGVESPFSGRHGNRSAGGIDIYDWLCQAASRQCRGPAGAARVRLRRIVSRSSRFA